MPAPKGEGCLTLGRSGVGLSSNRSDGAGHAVQSTLNLAWGEPEGLSVAHRVGMEAEGMSSRDGEQLKERGRRLCDF